MIDESRFKYETIEQRIRRLFLAVNSVLLVISALFFMIGSDIQIEKLASLFLRFSIFTFGAFLIFTVSFSLYILEKNNFREIGIEQVIFNLKIKYRLEKALLDSKIYFERMNLKSSENTILVSLPEIKINIEKDSLAGEVLIQNSIRYQDKLERIDLSSAVASYVQESAYLLDNREWYVFNLESESSDARFNFDSLYEMKKQMKSQSLYLDEKFDSIPYYHWLISGQTGSGKTYGLYSLIIQLKLQDVSLTIIDPKSSNLAVFADLLGVERAVDTQEILMTLRHILSEMNQRKKDVMQSVRESSNIDSTALDFGYQPTFIVIDEFAALQLRLDRKQSAELDSLIGQILLEGRSLGFYLILAMQQANAQLISTNLREQFQVQIVMGQSGIQTYNVVFGPHLASLIPTRNMNAGEGWAMISGQTTTPRLVRFPFLNFEISEELLRI